MIKPTTKDELTTIASQIATKATTFCQTLENSDVDANEYDALAFKEVCAALHDAMKLN